MRGKFLRGGGFRIDVMHSFPPQKSYSIPEGREIRSIKTGTCLHLNRGLAQKRNFNPKSKQEKYQRKFKSRVDHGKIDAKWQERRHSRNSRISQPSRIL